MARYLDPKNDLIFKRIFGEHEHLCMSLLNSMLPLEPEQQIVELKYQSPELTPDIPVLKDSIVDVHCIDNLGRQFIVEMQMHWTPGFQSRVLFNASKAYVKQLDRNKEYRLLRPVFALNLVNKNFDSDPSAYYHHYRIVNVANTEKRIEGLEFVFIELLKFIPSNKAEKKLYNLWLRFLTELNEGDKIPSVLLEEDVIKEAVQYLESSSYTKEELDAYDRYWDSVRTQRTFYLDALAEGRAEGEAIGLQKGRAEGRTEGKAEGRTEGRAEGRAEAIRDVVLSAHCKGFSLSQIQILTNLPEEKIREIVTYSA